MSVLMVSLKTRGASLTDRRTDEHTHRHEQIQMCSFSSSLLVCVIKFLNVVTLKQKYSSSSGVDQRGWKELKNERENLR